jgi:uncharacterized protein YjdB
MGKIIENLKDKSEYGTARNIDDLQDVNVVDVFDYEINNSDGEINPSDGDQSNYEVKREINDNRNFNYHYHAHRDIGEARPLTAGISLSDTEIDLEVGDESNITATVTPADADQRVTYVSDNESVATVSDAGVVEGISEGTANITVTTADGVFSAVCVVTVSDL